VDLHRAVTLRLLCRMPPDREGAVPSAVLALCDPKTSPLVRREVIALCAAWGDCVTLRTLIDTIGDGPWEQAVAAMNMGDIQMLVEAYVMQNDAD